MGKTSKPVIFGTGLIALDVLMSDNPDAPVTESAGGTCGNVLTILSFLGWKALPIARMNGDPASVRVKADMERWGVDLDYASAEPQTSTPIIIQQLYHTKSGAPRHKFDWVCPKCGKRLPSFKPVTRAAIEFVGDDVESAKVFFLDRVSRGALALAEKAAANGAVIYFEPSGIGDPKLFREAVGLADIVKYAKDRIETLDVDKSGSLPLVEIQTLGAEGLRVRDRLDGKSPRWRQHKSILAPVLRDTCGAGDWCTAGIIEAALAKGRDGLKAMNRPDFDNAIKYGQKLAAWNCGFEGARGGMYAVKTLRALNEHVGAMNAEDQKTPKGEPMTSIRTEIVDCPSCH